MEHYTNISMDYSYGDPNMSIQYPYVQASMPPNMDYVENGVNISWRKGAVEPKEFVNQLKICQYCQSNAYKFKFLNNKKRTEITQPWYQCLASKKFYTYVDRRKGTNWRPRGRTSRKKKGVETSRMGRDCHTMHEMCCRRQSKFLLLQ